VKRDHVHRLWAPRDATWSPWVKPVLFAHLDEDRKPEAPPSPPPWIVARVVAPRLSQTRPALGGQPPYRSAPGLHDTALILDLPGAAGVRVGVGLARYGFRPVPLYNAIPERGGIVNLDEIMETLVDTAGSLSGLAVDAPPAFLLDQRRMGKGARLDPGKYDNRSVVFINDFPSAKTLWSAGIRSAALVQRERDSPAADLAPILLAWQEYGIEILLARTDVDRPIEVLRVVGPALFETIGQWFDRMGLRRRDDGTFGGVIPERSSGG
jgi:hypothetical protein